MVRRWIGLGIVAIISGAAMLPASRPLPAQPFDAAAIDSLPADDGLTVLTYNVQGLPWPVALGRTSALGQIGARLHRMRERGSQPRIVLLQEAFTDAAKEIGAAGGYRYIVSGPGRDLVEAPAQDGGSTGFVQAGRRSRGEGMGKFVDSGLQILSDYPVLAVRRQAFSAAACAGFDCLANKGMLLVLVQPPNSPVPIAIVDTHLNARKASGVSPARSFEAYRRQVIALDRFIAANVPPRIPLILAGDLNVGKSPARRALMRTMARRWLGGTAAGADGVLDASIRGQTGGSADLPDDARAAHARNKDWQVAVSRPGLALIADRISVPFGREAGAAMLSDHIGYSVHYRLATATFAANAGQAPADRGRP